MSARSKKAFRYADHHKMMEAFAEFLDDHWPLWRQHHGDVRYHDLLAAFKAGWQAA
jgi:hypothetical protein